MGWADYHLHHFQFGDVMYGAPTPEDRDMHDGRKIKLSTALVDGERAFDYVYDYGDNWCCVVVLEAVAPAIPGFVYPRSLTWLICTQTSRPYRASDLVRWPMAAATLDHIAAAALKGTADQMWFWGVIDRLPKPQPSKSNRFAATAP